MKSHGQTSGYLQVCSLKPFSYILPFYHKISTNLNFMNILFVVINLLLISLQWLNELTNLSEIELYTNL